MLCTVRYTVVSKKDPGRAFATARSTMVSMELNTTRCTLDSVPRPPSPSSLVSASSTSTGIPAIWSRIESSIRADEANWLWSSLEIGRFSDTGLSVKRPNVPWPSCSRLGVETWCKAASKFEVVGWKWSILGALSAKSAALRPFRRPVLDHLLLGRSRSGCVDRRSLLNNGLTVGRKELTKTVLIDGRVLGRQTSCDTL